jgi:hypothetical protein
LRASVRRLVAHTRAVRQLSETDGRTHGGAESEWPLFFPYLALDALFRDDVAEADRWLARLTPLLLPRPVPSLGLV